MPIGCRCVWYASYAACLRVTSCWSTYTPSLCATVPPVINRYVNARLCTTRFHSVSTLGHFATLSWSLKWDEMGLSWLEMLIAAESSARCIKILFRFIVYHRHGLTKPISPPNLVVVSCKTAHRTDSSHAPKSFTPSMVRSTIAASRRRLTKTDFSDVCLYTLSWHPGDCGTSWHCLAHRYYDYRMIIIF